GAIDYTPVSWQPMDFRVRAYSAIVNLRPPGDCWGILLTWSQPIASQPEFNIGFEYQFGGASAL
ncbi:MAG TPA: hypothetical protein VM432_03010, partial [Bdellovibrionales bacterium]|nr:hypothetical protein [Bdellovibrionales bacterium]